MSKLRGHPAVFCTTTDARSRLTGIECPIVNSIRLSPHAILPESIALPPVVPDSVGIVHLGWGAFHRAHQAIYTEDAMAETGDLSWGILGDVERTPILVSALREQGGRYSVHAVDVDADGNPTTEARVVGSVVDVAYPGDETGRLLATMAAPTTRVITLTITEKGYCRNAAGDLDLDVVEPDLQAIREELFSRSTNSDEVTPAATAIGLLVRGLLARYQAGQQPITVLSCDNMAHNGKILRKVVDQFLRAIPASDPASLSQPVADFVDWINTNTTWPSSMVDRITPAATPEVLNQIEGHLGHRDEAGVAAEPFMQWVIEDNFANERPAWDLVGADLVDDVAPWEEAKLRMLNGTHSLLAYAGRIHGYPTMAEAVNAPEIRPHAEMYMFADATPSVTVPAGADLNVYGQGLLHRFANPATGHTTQQVSTDGSQKIPFRWGGVLKHHLGEGRVPQGVAYGLAAWSEFVRRAVRDGVDLGDPSAAAVLTSTVNGAGVDNPAAVARALLAVPGLIPENYGVDPALTAAVVANVEELAANTSGLV